MDYEEEEPQNKLLGYKKQDAKPKDAGNRFLTKQKQDQEEADQKRSDKHLLPIDKFYEKGDSNPVPSIEVPYASIDLIFNHKNAWANLQNKNPVNIHYHLHKSNKWLPFIKPEHKYIDEEIEDVKPSMTPKEKIAVYKKLGQCMHPFYPFYDPKSIGPPKFDEYIKK